MQELPHSEKPVALVLAGGGARGAYEIGALSKLLPALDKDHERPQIVIGTSVGAINAAYFAANAHKPTTDLLDEALKFWGELRYGQVLTPLVSMSAASRLWAYAGEVLGIPGVRVESVLDPQPLSSTLTELIDFPQIHDNVEAGHLKAAAVVATSGATSLSVVFHDSENSQPKHDKRRGIDYVKTKLTEEHVRASSAIPVLFPAVRVGAESAQRWYFDGGTRLNTPIKPALALGAGRVIVIALNSPVPRDDGDVDHRRPDALDGATQLIQGVLVDPLVNDVDTLAGINEMIAAAPDSEKGVGSETEREAQMSRHEGAKRNYELRAKRNRVPYMLIAPDDAAEIGSVATDIYRKHFDSPVDLVSSPNVAGLGHLVNAATSANHGELLSYLFFAKEFTRCLIGLGQRDAEKWLEEKHDHGHWQLERRPLP